MNEFAQQRILNGDLDAYGEVVREHQDMLLGYALRRLSDWTLAEEVVQLTFIRAYQRLAEFRADEEFGVWLCVTCKYLILTELEKKRREANNLSNYREKLEVEIASAVTEDMEPDFQQDQLAGLRDCVGKLGREAGDLVALRYFNVFGPRQSPASDYAAVIPKFITRMHGGERPTIFGDGSQTRDFCFIANVVGAEACMIMGHRSFIDPTSLFRHITSLMK